MQQDASLMGSHLLTGFTQNRIQDRLQVQGAFDVNSLENL
jgi:hypothetical protein